MVRSAAAEMPKLGFRVVDLCPCEPSRERDAAFLLRELARAGATGRARRIRLAQARAQAPRLAPLPVPRLLEGGPVVDADVAAGVHVVSGGTGASASSGRGFAAAGGKAATLVLASTARCTSTPASLKTPVDTFVLFSSIYGLLGSRELTHYGAANAFQDGLAAARARAGLPALAVSWGTWADAGMAHRFGSGFEAHVKSTGMRFVPLDGGFQALAALSQVAGRTQCHAAVLPADWAQYAAPRRAGPHPLAGRLAAAPAAPAAAAAPPAAGLLGSSRRPRRRTARRCSRRASRRTSPR
ncbi:plipastatin synthase [Aureococcus anophagefferens]|uniref:Plipastatin synthase n=1 Tax=Aureococcus anophagefferens TaxID=44056 RepID=A0ABR1GCJ3_AURAN